MAAEETFKVNDYSNNVISRTSNTVCQSHLDCCCECCFQEVPFVFIAMYVGLQEELAVKAGKDHSHLVGNTAPSEQELFKKQGRCHSRLENIEYECWVFPRGFPNQEDLVKRLPFAYPADLYYWRTMFNPITFQMVAHAPGTA